MTILTPPSHYFDIFLFSFQTPEPHYLSNESHVGSGAVRGYLWKNPIIKAFEKMSGRQKKDPKWRSFEKKVKDFVRNLDPNATVTHDKKTPDIVTGAPRQRDIWMSLKIGGVIPLDILFSCKDKGRRFHAQDMDGFLGELQYSGAHKGVVCSIRGFTKEALNKAKKLSIECWQFFEDEAIPAPFANYMMQYILREDLDVRFRFADNDQLPEATLEKIKSLPVSYFLLQTDPDGNTYSSILANHLGDKDSRISLVSDKGLHWNSVSQLKYYDNNIGIWVEIFLGSIFYCFYSRFERNAFSGIVSGSEQEILGQFKGPPINLIEFHPGPDWEAVPQDRLEHIDIKST